MLLCFIYGGFSLILFLFQIYSVFWMAEVADFPDEGARIADINVYDLNARDLNRADAWNGRENSPIRMRTNPFAMLTSPANLSYLIGGLVAIVAGLTIGGLIREREVKRVKKETADNLLLPDEKAVVEVLKNSNYESTQSKIVKETGLGKVQVHRAVKRLEAKGALEKHNYGITNKIILKKELFE